MWSVKFQFGVRRAQCEVWSVRFGVWRKQWEVRSVKCEVWSVECEVWSLECEECSVKCGVWSVKTLLRLSLKKSNGCRGKDTVGTGCLWTIGHLCLGNFRRRLARVYVITYYHSLSFLEIIRMPRHGQGGWSTAHHGTLRATEVSGVASEVRFWGFPEMGIAQ